MSDLFTMNDEMKPEKANGVTSEDRSEVSPAATHGMTPALNEVPAVAAESTDNHPEEAAAVSGPTDGEDAPAEEHSTEEHPTDEHATDNHGAVSDTPEDTGDGEDDVVPFKELMEVMKPSCKLQIAIDVGTNGKSHVQTVNLRNISGHRTDEELCELAGRFGALFEGTVVGFTRVDTKAYSADELA